MGVDQILDFVLPLIGLFAVQGNLATVTALGDVADVWFTTFRAKIGLFISHDLVRMFVWTRARVLVAEAVLLAAAVALFFVAKGYCGPLAMSPWMLTMLIPGAAVVARDAVAVSRDWKVRAIPACYAELKTDPSQPDLDPDAADYAERLAARTTEVDKGMNAYGPRDRSPLPHMAGLIWSPFILWASLLAYGCWMGTYGTFSLSGIEYVWPRLAILLAALSLTLSGFGYKLVIGVARALALKLNAALAPTVTVMLRTVVTLLPTFDAANVATRVPAITGEFFEGLVALTEKTENGPIAKIVLFTAALLIAPHPMTAVLVFAAAYVIGADRGNQEAEGIDTTEQRRNEARALSPWLRRGVTALAVGIIVLGMFRSVVVETLLFGSSVLNPFLSLGLPTGADRSWPNWILPIMFAVGLVLACFRAATFKSLPGLLQKAFVALGVVFGVVLAVNLMRAERYQINEERLAASLACPLPPPPQALLVLKGGAAYKAPPAFVPATPTASPAPVAAAPIPPPAPEREPSSRHRARGRRARASANAVVLADAEEGCTPYPGAPRCVDVPDWDRAASYATCGCR